MLSYFKNLIPGKNVNDIPLSAVYNGIFNGGKKEGNITINLKTGMIYYGFITN